MEKTCSRCKETKELSEFSPSSYSGDGYRCDCKSCGAEKTRDWYARNKEVQVERAREYRKNGRATVPKAPRRTKEEIAESKRRAWVKHKYGIEYLEYDAMIEAQDGKCAICGEPPVGRKHLDVDHCHETGKVRGLLCYPCNRGIGNLGDDSNRVMAAAAYLIEYDTELEEVLSR